MGFWANLLTHKKKRVQQFDEASTQIRDGVFRRLLKRYTPVHGPETGRFLAAAATGEIFSRKEPDVDVGAFVKSNRKMLNEALDALRDDEEIRRAASVLILVTAAIMSKQSKAFQDDFTGDPLQRLKERGLFLEGTREPLVEDFLRYAQEFHDASPS